MKTSLRIIAVTLVTTLLLIPKESPCNPQLLKLARVAFKYAGKAKSAHEAYKLVSSFVGSSKSTVQAQELKRAIYYIEQSSTASEDGSNTFILRADEILDKLWLSDDIDNEMKTNVAFFKGAISVQRKEMNQAISWWKRVLGVPFDKKFLSSDVSPNENMINIKQASAASICQNLDQQNKDIWYYCGLSYLFNKHPVDPYLSQLDRCVRAADRVSCGKLGIKLISDVIQQDKSTSDRIVSVQKDKKVFIEIALRSLIPQFSREDLIKATDDDLIIFYWLSVGLEALNEMQYSSRAYKDLCLQKLRSNRFVKEKIIRACQVATNSNHWNLYTPDEKVQIGLEACLNKGFSDGCWRLMMFDEGMASIGKQFDTINREMSYRYINNGDSTAYLVYHTMNQYSTSRYIAISKVTFSASNSEGSSWDLMGNPDPLLVVKTSTDITIMKTKLSILGDDGYQVTAVVPQDSRFLPFNSKGGHVKIRLYLYDEDNTELELIDYIEIDSQQEGNISLRGSGGLLAMQAEAGSIPREKHPFSRIMQALKNRTEVQ